MLRADLVQTQKQEYTLVVTLHHIASDGWSTSVMVKEVVELYNAIDQKREPTLKPLQIIGFIGCYTCGHAITRHP